MLTEFLDLYGLSLLGAVLAAAFGAAALLLKGLSAKYLDTDVKRTLARLVVQFAEQTFRQLHGEDKLNAALSVLAELLTQKGIRATELEMKVLLEAAVAEFNGVFRAKNAAAPEKLPLGEAVKNL